MKKIILILLLIATIAFAVGCQKNPVSSSSSKQVESKITNESITTEIQNVATTQSLTTQTTEIITTQALTQESTGYTDRQAVEAFCIEYDGKLVEPYIVLGENSELVEYKSNAEYLMKSAESLSEKCLGNISSEEDLIEKARLVFINYLGAEYIERVEADYVDVDGVKIALERKYSPYTVKYYENYDLWFIVTNPPSGIREDGVAFDVIWDFPPYLLIKGQDGMILGAFFRRILILKN